MMARFLVEYSIRGRASRTIDAESLEAATARIEAEVDDDNFDIDLDDIDDLDFDVREMHPVTRGGRELWTTYIQKEDVRGHVSAVNSSPLFAGTT